MSKNNFFKSITPLLALFCATTALSFAFSSQLDTIKIDHRVVLTGNTLIFMLTVFAFLLHFNASKSNNPNVLFRSVMGSTMIKMLIVAVAVLIYVKKAKPNVSIYGVVVNMALYLLYTFFEVKSTVFLNKKTQP